jgi:hypothetical protein
VSAFAIALLRDGGNCGHCATLEGGSLAMLARGCAAIIAHDGHPGTPSVESYLQV